ncbi:OsmC family protein [Microvirga puerhi]|uniref:OsmC family protein n=1 Tax=Microvirga puerhi TaxID=2876078 RepID=A0ABS7VJE1_9HYPH|nr:OsmC family protein [Microvirga puerhi]MBZ6075634.1 OsmC family protein [Microvirga puerhi]
MATIHLASAAGYRQEIRARTHTLTADEPASLGGTDSGPSPYELLLASLAACTSLTLRMYADRKGWELGRVEVDARFARDEAGTESITREVRLSAPLSPEQQTRLAEICEKTPVTKTLKRGTPIATTLRVMA